MSIIEVHKSGDLLEVKVFGGFNLGAKNMLKSRLSDEITRLKIDLSDCKFIDSEGVIFMYRWQSTGKGLEIVDPPDILFEILDILELSKQWNLNYIKK